MPYSYVFIHDDLDQGLTGRRPSHLLHIVLDHKQVSVEHGVVGQVAIAHATTWCHVLWECQAGIIEGAVRCYRIAQVGLQVGRTTSAPTQCSRLCSVRLWLLPEMQALFNALMQ